METYKGFEGTKSIEAADKTSLDISDLITQLMEAGYYSEDGKNASFSSLLRYIEEKNSRLLYLKDRLVKFENALNKNMLNISFIVKINPIANFPSEIDGNFNNDEVSKKKAEEILLLAKQNYNDFKNSKREFNFGTLKILI